MGDTGHQINLALRTAAGHARAAGDVLASADRTYEMKMKSAGASVWEAWALAVRSQPEFSGRKIDDRALARIYSSSKPRKWWDSHLSAVKVEGKPANREWAKRTLQWHTDPDAAKARRAKDNALCAARARKVKELREKTMARGRQRPQAEPTTAEMRTVTATEPYKHGYDRPWLEDESHKAEIDRLVIRIRQAMGYLGADRSKLAEAAAMLRLVAEGLEAL